MVEQTLSGVKVLDLTWYIAGPHCTKLFADFGADVIKVEKPGEGDPARHIGPFLGNDPHPEKSMLFSHLNLNKKSIILDLKSNQGKEVVKELVRDSDIVVESFSPGVMERLGLDYHMLKAINPELVMTSISNFGQTGPYRYFKASELVLNGIAADMYMNGIPGREPLKLGGNCMQYQVGHMAAAATIAAYWLKRTHGIGQYIDVSAQQVLATDTDYKTIDIVSWAYTGTSMGFKRDSRDVFRDITPSGVYPCKDGFVRVAGGIMFWDRFIKLFPELGEQFSFPDDITEVDNKEIVDAIWYDWCADLTKHEIMEACQEVKFFGMALNTPKDAIESPQFKERGFWVEIEHPVTGKQIYPGDPLHMELTSWKVRMPAPLLGQHNEEIMGTLQKSSEKASARVVETGKNQKKEIKKLPQPLEGIRVVDMGVIWAVPYAAWLLGCLGAEVIHLDNPHHQPDFGRLFHLWPTKGMLAVKGGRALYPEGKPGERPWNRMSHATRNMWNRLSCCIDVDTPEGKEVFKRLIQKSDVFIENNSATAMEHLGLGHEVLMKVNPCLICINMPAWGRGGPYKDFVGWGAMHQSVAGEEWIRGYNDDEHPSHNCLRFHMDSTSGPMSVFAAVMGLIHRERTGRGQWVDYAQMEAMMHHYGEIYMDAAWNGNNQGTLGNRHPAAIQGCYRCRGLEPNDETAIVGGERWITITIHNDEEWESLCSVMGNPEWTKQNKFATHKSRYENHDEIDRHLEQFTRNRDNFELFYVLQDNGIPAGPVEDWRDTYMDPQLNARGFFQTITGPDTGTYRYPGFPWEFSETPCQVKNPPCRVGEHNEYVYKEVIGLSADEITELEKKKIIGDLKYEWAGEMPQHLIDELPPEIFVL